MLYIKFFGVLQEYYSPYKKIDYKKQKLKDLLKSILREDDFANDYLRVLVNGKYFAE